jgi:AraC-like DNA-binding protein
MRWIKSPYGILTARGDIIDNRLFILEKFANSTSLCVRGFNNETKEFLFRFGLSDEHDPVMKDSVLRKALLSPGVDTAVPVVRQDHPDIAYGIVANDECYVVLGPVCTGSLEQFSLDEYAMYRGVPPGNLTIPVMEPQAFDEAVLLCQAVAGTIAVSINRCPALFTAPESDELLMVYQETVLQATELGTKQLGYDDEQELLGLVRKGDTDALLKYKISRILTAMGHLSDDAFKQREYTACILITLAARAAILGGLSVNFALSLQNLGMQRLANCRSVSEIGVLCSQAMLGFAGQVKQQQSSQAQINYIEKTKQYIDSHLSTPFTLEQAAEEVGINHQYLSRRFKTVEGIGFKQYVQARRLQAAANMLRFSDMPIIEIASYFCYPTQSHFCKIFRERFGITPQKYRRQWK